MAKKVYSKATVQIIEVFKQNLEKAKKFEVDTLVVEDIIPNAHIYFDYEVNANWTIKSFDEVKHVLGEFAKRGYMLKEYLKDDLNPVWRLVGTVSTIRLSPNWSYAEDAQCRRVKVGTKMREVDVYKIVCEGKETNNVD